MAGAGALLAPRLGGELGGQVAIGGAAGVVGGLLALVGGGLGLVALVRGATPAWRGVASLALLATYALGASAALVVATQELLRRQPSPRTSLTAGELATGELAAGEPLVDERFAPPPPWRQIEAHRYPGAEERTFARDDLGLTFQLVVEASDEADDGQAAAERTLRDLQRASPGLELLERGRLALGAREGILLRASGAGAEGADHSLCWCWTGQGWSYQLTVWGPASLEREAFDAAARAALSGFQPLEGGAGPARGAARDPQPAAAGPVASPAGWSLAALPAPWRPWPGAARAHPVAELGLLHGGEGGLLVVPLWLGELEAPPEALLQALRAALALPADAAPLGPARPLADAVRGGELTLLAPGGGRGIEHRLRLLRGPDRGLLLYAWSAGDPRPFAALEQVALAPGPAAPPGPARRAAEGPLLSGVGRWFLDAERPAEALPWLVAAREAQSDRLDPWLDQLDALADLDRLEEALALARTAAQAFPAASEPASWEAWCLAQLGRPAAARAAYEALLARPGPAREGDLRGYAELLRDQGDGAAALALCQRAIDAGQATVDTWLLKATLEEDERRYQAALASLERALALAPRDAEVRERRDALRAELGKAGHEALRTRLPGVAIPAGLLPPLPAPPPAPRGAGARYLERTLCVRFVPGRELVETERARVELLDQRGVNAFATWRVPFDPGLEDVWVERLRVLGPDGAVLGEGERDSYYVVADGSTWEASEAKLLCAPVPELAPGRTLEVEVTRARRAPPQRFGFLRRVLSAEVPVQRGALVLTGELGAVRHVVGGAGISLREAPGARAFVVANPPVTRWEPGQPEGSGWLPRVELGDADVTWAAVGQEYLADLVEPLEPAPEAGPLAARALEGVAGHVARVSALCELVRRELTYQAILFGMRAWVPRPVSEVLRTRWGDCKEHSLLLWQLLRAAGMEAHLALVSVGAPVQPLLPAQDQFDHMVVFVPDPPDADGTTGGGRFLDATEEDAPPGLPVPAALAGGQALVLDPAGPRLVAIPPCPPGHSAVTLRREARVSPAGDLLLEETLRVSGYAAAELRSFLRELALDAAGVRIQRELMALGAAGRVQEVAVEGLDDLSAPLVVRTRFVPDARLDVREGALRGRIPSPWARWWLVRERAARASPLRLGAPLVLTVETVLLGPGGPAALPTPASREGRYLRLDAQATPYRVEVAGGHVSAAEYPGLLEEIEAVLAALEPVVEVR